MKHFFRKLDLIDAVLQNGASRESAARLVAQMTDLASTVYVLNTIDGSWLEPLESTGYFRDLSLEGMDGGDNSNGFWPVSIPKENCRRRSYEWQLGAGPSESTFVHPGTRDLLCFSRCR